MANVQHESWRSARRIRPNAWQSPPRCRLSIGSRSLAMPLSRRWCAACFIAPQDRVPPRSLARSVGTGLSSFMRAMHLRPAGCSAGRSCVVSPVKSRSSSCSGPSCGSEQGAADLDLADIEVLESATRGDAQPAFRARPKTGAPRGHPGRSEPDDRFRRPARNGAPPAPLPSRAADRMVHRGARRPRRQRHSARGGARLVRTRPRRFESAPPVVRCHI